MKVWVIIALIMLSTHVNAKSTEYSVIVEENGNSLVLIALEGGGTYELMMPLDVSYPQVLNAIYVESASGVDVSVAEGEPATVAYQTSLLTEKDGGKWTLNMKLESDTTQTMVSLPKKARIISTNPKAVYSENEDSKNAVFNQATKINIEYTFEPTQASTTTLINILPPTTKQQITTTTLVETKKEGLDEITSLTIFILGAIVALAIAAAAYIYLKTKDSSNTLKKQMRTLSGNEYKIVDTLLKNEGGMKRNDLEKIASISKSSLALTLNNLERKNIIEVDRTNSTHYVEVTEWFKNL